MAKPYRYIGKATPRKDAVEIVTGKAIFTSDVKVPNMLYGKVLRSPYPHANIVNIDARKAKALSGVEAVLTYKDVPDWIGGMPRHRRVLDSKVRFVGDSVALVAAKTEEIAMEALEQIEVKYEQLPAVYDVEEAMKPGAPQLYDHLPGNVLPPNRKVWGPGSLQEVVFGDVEEGFKEADIITEGTYVYENMANPLASEAPCVIAHWEEPNKLTVWTGTQGPHMLNIFLSKSMKVTDAQLIVNHAGGTFGGKAFLWEQIFQAAALSKATHKPVKVCYTRGEQLVAYTLRLGSRIHGKVGMKKDGTVTAISGDWLINAGAFSEMAAGQIAVGCGEVQLIVRCPNWRIKPKAVLTTRNASGVIRGYGGQELKCAFLPILTLAMEKADVDPMEFFKKNYVNPGDGYYWRDGNWWVYRGASYTPAIEKGAERFGWKEKWKGWLKPTAVNGMKRKGVGVGVHGNADTGEDTSEAYVRLNPDGSAVLYSSICEHGTGQRSNICKMVAEVLQLPLERVNITAADTLVNPYDLGPGGSRGTYAIGSAVIAAAEDAMQKLFEMVAPMLKAKPEDLETEDGLVYVKGKPEVKVTWQEVMGTGFERRTCLGTGRFTPDFSLPNFMMVFAEVEVDVETGKVELIQVVTATDVGQIIDPPCLENQLYGCLGAAGLDSALIEETILDENTGHILSANMIDYKWRTFPELPIMQNVILETPRASHRFHAIGVGEIAPAPGPSAVLMAVSNAIGTRLHVYPVTPDKILKALGKTKGGAA
jgi:xanthine dehydrogenase molybdenum-binding subunit